MRRKIAAMALVIAIAISSIVESMAGGGDAASNLHDPGSTSGQGNDQNDKLRSPLSMI
jgi:hypothetical protein